MKREITHLPERSMFTVTENGETAHAEYTISNGIFDIVHTYVPAGLRNRGIAGELVGAAYGFAESRGLKLNGTCTYASYWLLRHQK